MKKLAIIAALAASCLVSGCQTRATIEKNPETAVPIYKVVEVNGVQSSIIADYIILSGGWTFTFRSPLWAKEQLKGLRAEVCTNGVFSAEILSYDRDLSTNAVVMTKTIFDGSANLALAVAKAYATISTGGASDAGSSIVQKAVAYFKSRGGDAAKSTVITDGKLVKITDGSTCVSCDALGNCASCSDCTGGACSD